MSLPMRVEGRADFLMPDDVQTVGVKVRCGCGPVLRAIPLHVTMDAILFYRQFPAPRDLIVQSYRCSSCHQKVKITAAMLYLAA